MPATALNTPEFRGAFVALFKPSKPKDAPAEQEPKYSIKAIFPPGTDLTALKNEAHLVAAEKWGADKIPRTLRSPFRKNADMDKPTAEMPDDAIVMTFSAAQDRRPGLVDGNLADIIDASKVYSGAYFRAQVRAFAYEAVGNKGVSFGLQNVQLLRDGEPIGNSSVPANKAFDAVVAPAGASAASMFD